MAILAKALQPAKTQAIEETKKAFSEYNDFIFTEYRGLTVEQITALRNKLREHEAPLKVVKNNFARVAFEELKIENVADYLKGPTAVVMAKEDSNEAAKVAENAKTLLAEIDRKKPADAKADFVRSVSVSSSMGPGVWVETKEEA